MLQQVRKTESSIIYCLIFLNILMVFWFVFFLIMIIKQKEKNHYFGVWSDDRSLARSILLVKYRWPRKCKPVIVVILDVHCTTTFHPCVPWSRRMVNAVCNQCATLTHLSAISTTLPWQPQPPASVSTLWLLRPKT